MPHLFAPIDLLCPGKIQFSVAMYIQKNFNFRRIMRFNGGHIIWITAWVALVTFTYEYTDWAWMQVPWLPLSVIGADRDNGFYSAANCPVYTTLCPYFAAEGYVKHNELELMLLDQLP